MARFVAIGETQEAVSSRTVTAGTTVLVTDYLIRANEGAALTVTLPAITASLVGHQFVIKKLGNIANITIARTGSDLIDGAASYILTLQNQSVTVYASALLVWDST